MEKEAMEMLQTILSGIEGMEKRINAKAEGETRGGKIPIENDVGKRIDALFDGCKPVHEKQWKLEKKVEKLIGRIEKLEATGGIRSLKGRTENGASFALP